MSSVTTKREPYPEGLGPDPDRYFLKLFVAFLQGWFNFLPAEHPYYWTSNDQGGRIWIGAEAPVKSEIVQQRPGITVVWGPRQTQGLGIDNMVRSNIGTHQTLRTDLESGFLVVYAIAKNDLEATRIARLVMTAVRGSRQLLESSGGFFQIARHPMSMNTPSPPGALVPGAPTSDLRMVQVNIPCSYQLSWETGIGRQAPQHRNIGQILAHANASEYAYLPPEVVERIDLSLSIRPVRVRVLQGRFSPTTRTTLIGDPLLDFQSTNWDPQEQE